eukprot:Gregarina_sp_Poly_1__8275@NODE_482_length_8028_cov_274_268559_g152_i1_p4_GENE_NODE_482_length_8028_cov_274_268559_g152_i1NODE_482_length_8028_cov_274_268559_g152_i1_p4_ORF_typecomplete_len276_score37_44_NODE_482_length_8028_cov_274_268559_g152_i163147141
MLSPRSRAATSGVKNLSSMFESNIQLRPAESFGGLSPSSPFDKSESGKIALNLPSQFSIGNRDVNQKEKALLMRKIDNARGALKDREIKNAERCIVFVREKLSLDSTPECWKRENAFLLWLFMFAAELERLRKPEPVVLACDLVESLFESTVSRAYENHMHKLRFLLRRVFEPCLQQIVTPRPRDDPHAVVYQILYAAEKAGAADAKVHSLQSRGPYLNEAVVTWQWQKAVELRSTQGKAYQEKQEALIQAMDDCRWTGEKYDAHIASLVKLISR